jgi:hypothetical protein
MSVAEVLQHKTQGFTAEQKEGVEELIKLFAGALVSWNLEEEAEDGIAPVPATYEGLMDQDMDFVIDLILSWMDGVVSISDPLSSKSSDGEPPPAGAPEVLSIPMERSLANLSS